MNRTKLTLIGSVAAIILLGAVIFALQSGDAYAGHGPGRTSRGAMGTGGPTPTPTPYVCPQSIPVQIINSPSPSNGQNDDQLNGMAALSSTNIWAVGSSAGGTQALIEHDDGTGWAIVPSPTPAGSQLNALYGIAAIAANDIWVVGQTTPPFTVTPNPEPLIEHWDGAAWTISAGPNIPGTYANFGAYAMTALSSNNVWLVGANYYAADGSSQLLVEHWDGNAWNLVSVASPSGDATLYGITALSATNIWAVGQTTSYNGQTLIEHFDGTSWSVVPSSGPGQFLNYLTGVAAISPTNIWAVGYATNYDSEPHNNQTLVEHWNGTSWSVVPSPNPGAYNSIFQAVGADSDGDIWAAGAYEGYTGPGQALVERWNGTSWTQFAAPGNSANGASDFQLNSIAVLSRLNVWFVGFDFGGSTAYYQTLAAHYPRPFLGINCPLA